MVHLRTQQETGKTTFDIFLYHSCMEYTKVHLLYSLTTSGSFSLSAMEHTSPKPKACPRCALSQRRTPQFGCVAASTQTTHLTVMARTSRTSLQMPHCINQPTLKHGIRRVFGWLGVDKLRLQSGRTNMACGLPGCLPLFYIHVNPTTLKALWVRNNKIETLTSTKTNSPLSCYIIIDKETIIYVWMYFQNCKQYAWISSLVILVIFPDKLINKTVTPQWWRIQNIPGCKRL